MDKRVPWFLVNSYGLANFTFTLMMFLGLFYYANFLTDVALISAGHVAVIMFITHIVDAVSIPFSGGIIQKTRMPWGRFRSWLTFIPVTTCIFFTLTFTNLPLSYGIKMVYLSAVYILANISLNFAYNAHMGMISVLSTDSKDRLRLSSRNMQFGMASQAVFSLAVVPMLLLFSRQSTTWGFFYTTGILGIVQIFGYWNLFYQTKGYEEYTPSKKITLSHNMTVPEMVMQIFGNKYLMILMCADSAVNLGIFNIQTLAVYYFKYVSKNEAWISAYSLTLGIATFTSTIIGPIVAGRIGKKNTYLLAAIYSAVGYLVLRIYGASGPVAYIGIVCMIKLGAGLFYPLRQAMFMDTAEYGYYRTGKDASAFIMSMLTLPTKVGTTLAGTVATAGLAFIGYEAGMEATDQFISSLMNIICFIPVVCGVIAFSLMLFYSLSEDRVAEYMKANKIKRAEAK